MGGSSESDQHGAEDPGKEDIIERDVPIGSLFNYASHEPIIQNYRPEKVNLNEEELLEIYTINKE